MISANRTIIKPEKQKSEGYILFPPIFSRKTYLIDKDGGLPHCFKSKYLPADSVFLKDNGNIIRSTFLYPHPNFLIMFMGTGGGIQEITPNGTVLWNYKYIGREYVPHHDIHLLPNGNILLLCWELKYYEDIIKAGKNPCSLEKNVIWAEYLIEIEPIYPTGGSIIWEWHVWDHLIQDYDSSKDNYGVIKDHPELVDINAGKNNEFWTHCDAIDYNKELDQIMLTVNNFNEIWIIDHSTSTEEASGHTGGDRGKGGGILYRWGNPKSYGLGDENDQYFYGQHDGRWIESGCPGEGNILVFNNGESRPGEAFSSVDEIVPPIDEYGNYTINPGEAYGPNAPIWSYTSDNPTDFYCSFSGSAQRLENGNTLICNGFFGHFFEVTKDKKIVWEYTNKYPIKFLNPIYSFHQYNTTHPGIQELIDKGFI